MRLLARLYPTIRPHLHWSSWKCRSVPDQCPHIHTHTRMHARTNARTHARTQTHTHTHTHTHAHQNTMKDRPTQMLQMTHSYSHTCQHLSCAHFANMTCGLQMTYQ